MLTMASRTVDAEVVAMRALVVYESMYGNTKEIATAIADGLSTRIPVQLTEVGAAPTVIADDIALLVVGAPTHGHGMSKDASRKSAAERTSIDEPPVISRGVGLREWLENLEAAPAQVHVSAAVFDTRIKGPRLLWGSAAHAAEPHLRRAGQTLIAPPESFLIGGPRGPVYGALLEGEVERAREWGEELANAIPTAIPA
ncbi:MAG: flavodoxin family protein [Chloroflexota bacterium]